MVEYVKGHTYHGRLGKIRNSFTYKVDFVFFDENDPHEIKMFSHNKANLFSIFDRDHGGLRNFGKGFSWARDIFSRNQIDLPEMKIKLLILIIIMILCRISTYRIFLQVLLL